MTSAELIHNLPVLLPTAAFFALIGWWLRGKKKPAPAPAPVAARPAAPSQSDRQKLRDLESKLRASESAAQSAQAELAALRSHSISKEDHTETLASLESARTHSASLESQLKKSRDLQASLQSQINEAGKKSQARAIGLENELASARSEIQRLKAFSDPKTDSVKRLEGEIEIVRTRLRAVEAQLAERNAELNALKAKALSSTARPPRTIASNQSAPGAALNLLGVETAQTTSNVPSSAPASPALSEAPFPQETAVSAPEASSSQEGTFSGASAIMGKPVQADDLTLIEGISAEVQEKLHQAGLTTWQSLAAADPQHLQSLIAGSSQDGPSTDLSTWPEQARLASEAKWFQLKSLQEKLLSPSGRTAYV